MRKNSGIDLTLIIYTSTWAEKTCDDQNSPEKERRPCTVFKINNTGPNEDDAQPPS